MCKILSILLITIVTLATNTQSASATTLILRETNIVPTNGDPDPVKVKAALQEFKNLSHREKRMMMKDVKQNIRQYKKEKKAGMEPSTNTLLLVILAILLPPLAVYLHEGVINSKFWIDLILTLLFYLPGMIYALIVVLKKD
jgi:uncharacterized membrane protein YqaE (UPF0057 family)